MTARLYREQSGISLNELLVGAAVSLVVLFAVIDLQMRVMRYQVTDEAGFVAMHQATILVDRVVRDLRQASEVTVTHGGTGLDLTLPGAQPVRYRLNAATGEVTREDGAGVRLAGHGIRVLQFALQTGERQVLVTAEAGFGEPQPQAPYSALVSLRSHKRP